MTYLKKFFLLLIILCGLFSSHAQNEISNPYSGFGIGGNHKKGLRRTAVNGFSNASSAWDDKEYLSALGYDDDFYME